MITVEFNDAVARDAFRRLAAAMTDMTQPLQDVADFLRDSSLDRMKAGVSPDGAPFAPRSPTTIARYEQAGTRFDHPLNVTHRLRNSFHSEAGPDYARVANSAIQAAVMHFGAPARSLGPKSPWGDIPARPFLGISDSDRTGIIDIVSEWLESLT